MRFRRIRAISRVSVGGVAMSPRLLLLALAITLPGSASANKGKGEGPKPETITFKCEKEGAKREKWDDKKNRTKERPGHWSQVCPNEPPPPPPPPPPPASEPPP